MAGVAGVLQTSSVVRHQVRTSGDLQIAYQVVGDGSVDVALAFDWGSNIELVWEHPQTERFLRRFASYGRLIFFDAFLTCAGFQDDASFLAARLRIRRRVGIPGRRAAGRGEAGVGGGRSRSADARACPQRMRGCSRVA